LGTNHLMNEWRKSISGPAAMSKAIKKSTMKRKLQHAKHEAKDHPKVPRYYDELAEIPERFTKTSSGDQFLIANEAIGHDGERIVIFASKSGMKMMQQANAWTADGTFDLCPKPFAQIYSFMAEIQGRSYPTVFCFMPNKKAGSYRFVLETIKKEAEVHGPLNLTQFVTDFESPVLKEFKTVFSQAHP